MNTPTPPSLPPGPIDPADPEAARQWCEHFGITATQLAEAVQAAGTDPAAVREHLLNQGASAGVG